MDTKTYTIVDWQGLSNLVHKISGLEPHQKSQSMFSLDGYQSPYNCDIIEPARLWNIVCNISRLGTFRNQWSNGGTININGVLVRYAIMIIANCNPTCRGPILNLHPLFFLDMWHAGPSGNLPRVQVKPGIWIALTSAYELRFECRSHCWIYNHKLFDLKLSLKKLWHFDFWA